MKHVTEEILIQYAFDLLEANAARSARQHIDACPECQQRLVLLQKKFSTMKVLNDIIEPSEALISKTLAVKAVPVKKVLFYRKKWVGWSAAAAAMVLIGVLFFQNLSDTSMKEPAPRGLKEQNIATLDTLVDRVSLLPSTVQGERKTASQNAVKIVSADEIPNQPPFAPASAIELVVLPTPDAMQLTIYNSADLTLVRDTRKLTLKPGWNWLQFMWADTLIDPTSLSLRPLGYADKIDIQQLVYPARLKDIGRWLIHSEVEGAVPFEITYFASGLSWQAFYMGTMNENETMMDLKGYVNVVNRSGQDFQNAKTRIIVGQTRLTEEITWLASRYYPYGPDIPSEDDNIHLGIVNEELSDLKQKVPPLLKGIPVIGRLVSNKDFDGFSGGTSLGYELKDIEKEGLSEYFLYTIEGTEDLPDAWGKRLQSFDVSGIPVKSLYKYDEDRYGTDTIRFVSFKNDAEHELGDTPIPEGNVRLYRRLNEAQNLSYIGSTDIKYIPVNEDVELNMGASPLVKIEPKLMDSKTDHYTFNPKGDIDGWDEIESWQMKLTNTREIPVEMEITRNFGIDYWELVLPKFSEGIEYKKHDKNRARFTAIIPPCSERAFEYTVTKYQQRRSEFYVKRMREQKP